MFTTIKINGKQFDVDSNGTITQDQIATGTELDEVRLAAAGEFLAYKRGDLEKDHISKDQRKFWQAVAQKTDVRNLSSRLHP